MTNGLNRRCIAFADRAAIGAGPLDEVALSAKTHVDTHPDALVLIFDDESGEVIELDFRGTPAAVLRRIATGSTASRIPEGPEPRTPGRPKLGVVSREVTLLPRHWDWLGRQPGGASVALRKLVEQARRVNVAKDRVLDAEQGAYRFMAAMAGNEPGFEEATRALFAGDADRFETFTEAWPVDVRNHARRIASRAFQAHTPA